MDKTDRTKLIAVSIVFISLNNLSLVCFMTKTLMALNEMIAITLTAIAIHFAIIRPSNIASDHVNTIQESILAQNTSPIDI